MTESEGPQQLLQGINHAAFAAADLDATVEFYADVFGLTPTELATDADAERNAFLFFPNGTFLHIIASPECPTGVPTAREAPGNLIYEDAALDHVALFANDTTALEVIHERLAGRGAADSAVVETGGVVQTVRFRDPDGRLLEVSAYVS